MFMPAHQIAAGTLGDAGDDPQMKRITMRFKTQELDKTWADRDLKLTTRRQAFDEGGIKTPLEMGHYAGHEGPVLDNGHHRLAWALQKNRNMELPVEHTSYGH